MAGLGVFQLFRHGGGIQNGDLLRAGVGGLGEQKALDGDYEQIEEAPARVDSVVEQKVRYFGVGESRHQIRSLKLKIRTLEAGSEIRPNLSGFWLALFLPWSTPRPFSIVS